MAQIPNTAAFTLSDGSLIYLNLDTVNQILQITNAKVAQTQSATAPDPGAAGTIATTGVGIARVSPAAARTGIILAAGTYPGQEVFVLNEAVAANTLTFNTTPATSKVANSATASAIAGLTGRLFKWDSSTSLWYPHVGT